MREKFANPPLEIGVKYHDPSYVTELKGKKENKNTIKGSKESYRVFQKFVLVVNCILCKALDASLGKCKLIQVRNLTR